MSNNRVISATVKMVSLVLFCCCMASGQDRFPRPEFESGYSVPQTPFPAARTALYEYMDVALLLAALGLAAWLSLKQRSRSGIVVLMIAAVLYFGFYRKGCICSVGSLQNMSAALFSSGFVLPLSVVLFFLLPLVVALFFGRVYCSSICPLGAVQDIVVLKPQRLPEWVTAPLKLVPHLYLGAAVLFAATGAGFLVCRYDPFVGIFRLGAPVQMVVFAAVLLAVGTVVARPYCRFLCPYGVLLGWMSYLSKWRVRITPDICVNCRLCEDACPFGAIQAPSRGVAEEPRSRSMRRIVLLGILIPVWMAVGGGVGYLAGDHLSMAHPVVHLAARISREETKMAAAGTPESEVFRSGSMTVDQLAAAGGTIKRRFRIGTALFGLYIGLVSALYLFGKAVQKKLMEYRVDPVSCLGCGRCYRVCPQEQERLKKTGKIRGATIAAGPNPGGIPS